MRYFCILSLVVVASCQSRKRPNDVLVPQGGDLPSRLSLSGPTVMSTLACTRFFLKTVTDEGTEQASNTAIHVSLQVAGEGAFFPGDQCLNPMDRVELSPGQSTASVFFMSGSAGESILSASDVSGGLGGAELMLQVFPLVSLSISNGPSYHFGQVYLSTTAEKTFTVSNVGLNPVAQLEGGVLQAPFAYKGGAFPGIGGSCERVLPVGGACSVVVAYAPTALGFSASSLVITYSEAYGTHTASRSLSGEGVSSGSLDSSFGQAGKITTAVGSLEDRAMAVLTEPSGRVVVAGSSIRSGTNHDTALVRYDPTGVLDEGFGFGGMATHALLTTEDRALGLIRQEDGKLVTVGYGLVASNYDFLVARFHENGSLDSSFGENGKAAIPVGASHDYGLAGAIQSDGRLVVAGYTLDSATSRYKVALARLLQTGALDTSFGVNGKVTVSVGSGSSYCFAIAIQPDAKIVAVGHASMGTNDIAVLRFNSDGSLDTGFASAGIKTVDINTSIDYGYAVSLQPDLKIVVAGTSHFGGASDFSAIRLKADGTIDSTFGNGGKVFYGVGPSFDDARTVLVQPDGRIVIAGSAHNGANYDFGAIRLFSDGRLDTSFGTLGKLVTFFGSGSDRVFASTLDSQNRIILVGDSLVGSTLDFALVRLLP